MSLKHLLILSIFLTFKSVFAAVESPVVSCVSVSGNNVQIVWETPVDAANEFVNFNIYFSSNASSSFTKVGTQSNFLSTSFTHTLASFNGNDAYFYITTSFTGGESNPKDTVTPIFLDVDNIQEALAVLSWNSPGINSAGIYYEIYKRKPGFAWQSIAVTSDLQYNDSVRVCADSIYYKVELAGNGCVSKSKTVGKFFQDNFAPSSPIIDSISVDPSSGYVHIGWQESVEGDVGGYIIALKQNNNWTFDTIWGKENTYFLDKDASAFDRPEEYGLLAFDTCWSGNPSSPNTSASGITHKSVFLIGESDACTRSINLNWNSYEGFQNGIGAYDIFVSENGGAKYKLTTLGASAISYNHDSLVPNANYCYTIIVRDGSGDISSSSNRICLTMVVPKLPKNHYLNKVTVVNDEQIEVSCFVDNNAAIEYYLLERAYSATGPFEIIDQINTPTDTVISYTDYNVDPHLENYYYKVVAVDVCGYEVNISNVSTNVFMELGNFDNEFKNKIIWNPYSDWDTLGSGVAFYNIYKGYGKENISNVPLAMVGGNIYEYEDVITIDRRNEGEVCYYVEAIEGGGNFLSFKERSVSNISCVKIDPKIYVPNAFTPNNDLKNDEFKPVLNFMPVDSYTMSIFDRYGHVIFETNNPDVGWDGGNYTTGVYTYKIWYSTSSGSEAEQLGSITLIK